MSFIAGELMEIGEMEFLAEKKKHGTFVPCFAVFFSTDWAAGR
jgi:hypothetical protein